MEVHLNLHTHAQKCLEGQYLGPEITIIIDEWTVCEQ